MPLVDAWPVERHSDAPWDDVALVMRPPPLCTKEPFQISGNFLNEYNDKMNKQESFREHSNHADTVSKASFMYLMLEVLLQTDGDKDYSKRSIAFWEALADERERALSEAQGRDRALLTWFPTLNLEKDSDGEVRDKLPATLPPCPCDALELPSGARRIGEMDWNVALRLGERISSSIACELCIAAAKDDTGKIKRTLKHAANAKDVVSAYGAVPIKWHDGTTRALYGTPFGFALFFGNTAAAKLLRSYGAVAAFDTESGYFSRVSMFAQGDSVAYYVPIGVELDDKLENIWKKATSDEIAFYNKLHVDAKTKQRQKANTTKNEAGSSAATCEEEEEEEAPRSRHFSRSPDQLIEMTRARFRSILDVDVLSITVLMEIAKKKNAHPWCKAIDDLRRLAEDGGKDTAMVNAAMLDLGLLPKMMRIIEEVGPLYVAASERSEVLGFEFTWPFVEAIRLFTAIFVSCGESIPRALGHLDILRKILVIVIDVDSIQGPNGDIRDATALFFQNMMCQRKMRTKALDLVAPAILNSMVRRLDAQIFCARNGKKSECNSFHEGMQVAATMCNAMSSLLLASDDGLRWARLFKKGNLHTCLFELLFEGFRSRLLHEQAAGVMLDALCRMADVTPSLLPAELPKTPKLLFATARRLGIEESSDDEELCSKALKEASCKWCGMILAAAESHPSTRVQAYAGRLMALLHSSMPVIDIIGKGDVVKACSKIVHDMGWEFAETPIEAGFFDPGDISLGDGFSSIRTESASQNPGSQTCSHCHEPSAVKLKVCSRCKTAAYCSAACQKAHWRVHKELCAHVAQKIKGKKQLK